MASAFKSLFAEPETTFGGTISPLMEKALASHKEKRQEKLLSVAVDVMNATIGEKARRLKVLQEFRKLEKQAKAELEDFQNRAMYFEATGNFGPLFSKIPGSICRQACQQLGLEFPDADDQKIPEGWKPE